jgi:hypothetical protein
MDTINLGGATLEVLGGQAAVSGAAFSGEVLDGQASPARVATADGAVLEVGHVDWSSGERDVRTFSRLTGPTVYDRLTKGCRLGVSRAGEDGLWMCELGIVTYHPDKQPTVIQAKPEDLQQVLRGDVKDLLERSGARAYGHREEILGDTGRRRNYLAVTFSDVSAPVPFVAYVLTRVLPLMTGFGKQGPVPVGAMQ